MSLTAGRGPLSPDPAGRFSEPVPAGVIYIEPYQRRIRARLGDRTVIDTERAQLVHRPGSPTSYAFPVDDVPAELAASEPVVPGHVTVAWASVDAWFEEDVELVHQRYPKNPYHRVDCLRTSRRLRVEFEGMVLTDSFATIAVFETALAPHLYVSKDMVDMELLSASASQSWCSYKGLATLWNAHVNGRCVEDVAWSYEAPLAESSALRGMLSFDERLVTVIADLPVR